MARFLVILWLSPIVLFSAWVSLSSLDWHFGSPFMTRAVHDRVFFAYEMILGYDRAAMMVLIRNALVLDAALLGALVAWQRRARLRVLLSRAAGSLSGRASPAG